MLDKIRALFPRPVRASLYAAGVAAVAALVTSGELPAWASPLAGPFLLALLNLSKADVEPPAKPVAKKVAKKAVRKRAAAAKPDPYENQD